MCEISRNDSKKRRGLWPIYDGSLGLISPLSTPLILLPLLPAVALRRGYDSSAVASLCTRQGLPGEVVHCLIQKTLEAGENGPAVSLWVMHVLLSIAESECRRKMDATPVRRGAGKGRPSWLTKKNITTFAFCQKQCAGSACSPNFPSRYRRESRIH